MKYTTLKFRIKDATTKKHLNAQAAAVNYVWNFCNEMTIKQHGYNGKYLSTFDLHKLTSGCSKELNLHGQAIESVCRIYVESKIKSKKIRLKWRSGKRSLGWIPFRKNIKLIGPGKFKFYGKVYRFWQTQDIGEVRMGSFSQDSKGRWYVNFVVKDTLELPIKTGAEVGVDLGLKTTATYSTGDRFDGLRPYREYQKELGLAQKAKKKRRVTAINAKIANIRKDSIHKETTWAIKTFDTVFVGDVSSKKLIKTKLSKSVHDVSWGLYRRLLENKANRLGKRVIHVNEKYSTVTCSECFERTFAGGLSALGVREWTCHKCGANHDRDVNAAINILRLGRQTLQEESNG